MKSRGIEMSHGTILIQFHLTNCPKCGMMASIIEDLHREYGDKVEFHSILSTSQGKLDPLAEKYKIMGAPTIMIFKDGEVIFKQINPSREELENALKGA